MSAHQIVDPLPVSLRALHSQAKNLLLQEVRFPNYRNLAANERLRFAFPVTVLLGCNGTNKSSILHAIRGSIRDLSVADYWFETKLDAIPETRDGLKQSVAHTYRTSSGALVESIKARAPRGASDPDYWEAVKPTTPYGFAPKQKRAPPLNAPVLLLDFRAELPAFDKYFYFPDPQHLGRLAKRAKTMGILRREYRKQDYLRRKSSLVKRALDESGVELTPNELAILGYILDRVYQAGRLVEHAHYHGHIGRTVRFTTAHIDGGYSDAFAGSGESAAAFLVHAVLNASKNSILLLDEPETSLHPSAQSRMLEFLCHQAVRKSLQIVMATHSVHLSSDLPREAIRVLQLDESGRVRVSESHTAREALHEIAILPPGRTVLVEDDRARTLVLARLRAAGIAAQREVRVEIRSGGTARIFREIQGYVSSRRNELFVLLDGDHRPNQDVPPEGRAPQGQSELVKLISELTKGPNSRGPDIPFVDADDATQYLDFLRERVTYLPSDTPEALVWSDLNATQLVDPLPREVLAETDHKKKIRLLAQATKAMSDDAVFQFLVSRFCSQSSAELRALDEIVTRLRS